jgi:uncharacterized protein YbaP (TraB family)
LGRFRKFAGMAVAILMGALGAAGAAQAAPALWVVRDADSEIYLFGTLHALPPGMAWRTPAYDAAYAKARTVWFEAEADNAGPDTLVELLARYGVDLDRKLSDRLPARDLAELRRQVEVAGPIDHLRPWAAAMMLSMQPMIERGARAEAGADLTMTRRSRRSAKTVRAFETLEDQARMFAGLPETSELGYLSQVIKDRRPRLTLLPKPVRMETSWLKGDFQTRLGPQMVAEMNRENPALHEALLNRRNRAWAEALTQRMAGAGADLVNVGALHMVGDDGLPALMRARGFTVQRIQ